MKNILTLIPSLLPSTAQRSIRRGLFRIALMALFSLGVGGLPRAVAQTKVDIYGATTANTSAIDSGASDSVKTFYKIAWSIVAVAGIVSGILVMRGDYEAAKKFAWGALFLAMVPCIIYVAQTIGRNSANTATGVIMIYIWPV